MLAFIGASTVAAVALGALLLVAATGKLADRAWPATAGELGVPPPIAPAVPVVEVALGALLITGVARTAAAWASAALLLAFTLLLAIRLVQGRRPPCACFGVRSTGPIGTWSIVRNLLLLALAVVAATA
jgi:uncharacterized membrane protein YphA (DoxX/SURF4 family)